MSNILLRLNLNNKTVAPEDVLTTMYFDTPNRIENYIAGVNYDILFYTDGTVTGDSADVKLYKDGVLIDTIATGITLALAGGNTVNYTFPADADGGDYYIEVDDTTKPLWFAYSDCFSIGNYNHHFALDNYTSSITFESVFSSTMQWRGDILSISDIVDKVGDNLSFESSTVNVALSNIDGYWNEIMQSEPDRFLEGAEAEIIETDGTSRRTYRVIDWSFGLNVFNITLGDRESLFLDEPLAELELITDEKYPDAPTGSLNQYIPISFGNFRSGGLTADLPKNTIKAYRVNDGTGTENYVYGKTYPDVITTATYRAWLPDGTEIFAPASFTISVGSDGLNYINYTATVEDYLLINFTTITIASSYTSKNLIYIMNTLFPTYKFDFSSIGTYFDVNDFVYDDEYDIAKWHYSITDNKSPKTMLEEVCRGLGLEYYISGRHKIVFKAFDHSNLTVDKTFQEGEIHNYSRYVDLDKRLNSLEYQTAYQSDDGSFPLRAKAINREGLRNWGRDKEKDTEYRIFPFERNTVGTNQIYRSHVPTKKTLIEFSEPVTNVTVNIDLDKVSDVEVLDIISFQITDGSALSTDIRYYQVRSIQRNYENASAILGLRDIDFLRNIQNKQTVLINSNNLSDSEFHLNDAVNGYNDITGDNVVNSTTQTRYGISSLYFQRSRSAHLQVGSSSVHEKIDFLDTSQTTEFTLEVDIYFNALGTQEMIYSQFIDANNYIAIYKNTSDKIIFLVRIGGANVVTLTSTTTFSATTWYKVTVCRDVSLMGLYIDENQEDYASYSTSHQLSTEGIIGAFTGGASQFLDGYMDGIEINFENKYELIPNSLNTDLYALPKFQSGINKLFNNKDVFVLHSNQKDTATTFTDSSPINPSTITGNGGIAHSTDFRKWGLSSIEFISASSQYLSIPTNVKFDIINQSNFTLDFWYNPNTSIFFEQMFAYYVDSSNEIRLTKSGATGLLNFRVRIGAVNVLDIYSTTIIPNATFSHIAIIKSGSDYGLYINGTQEAYVSYATAQTLAGTCYLGQRGNGFGYCDGYMDEFRISHRNQFSASPVVGLTDTITIPTKAYSLTNSTGN